MLIILAAGVARWGPLSLLLVTLSFRYVCLPSPADSTTCVSITAQASTRMVDEDVQPALANSIRSPKRHLQGFGEGRRRGKAYGDIAGPSNRSTWKCQQRSDDGVRVSSPMMDK